MIRSRLTSKGQVTIPIAIRRVLDLHPGDDLVFDRGLNGEVNIRALKRKRLTELYSSLPVTRPYPGKTKIREEVAGRLARRILDKEKET